MSSERGSEVLTVARGGERVDRYVAAALADLSRTAVQRLIEAGAIAVNGRAVQVSHKVRAGDVISVSVPEPEPVALLAEAIPLDVLYEDQAMLVISKAAGMVVHPGAGHSGGTLVNAVLAHCPDLSGVGGEIRPGIVHRLDRYTSGVMVVAKHDQALRKLQAQFKRRTVRKRYTALVVGFVPQDDGIIEAPIGRGRRDRQRMAVRADGKPSRTRWHVVTRHRDADGRRYTLLDVQLLTGRTHQIRVHFSWMGYPLAGDPVYGLSGQATAWPRQFLHSRELEIDHPVSGEPMRFQAPLPPDLREALATLTEILSL
ncbi:MAG: RluA family pseudouridine synthase [Anaerolineae bacterium]|nr:RluA family pseudouridine synthase [Anaerolineae bacterium]